MTSKGSARQSVRALLCTIPLDVGIPLGITNDPSRMVVMTGNLLVIPKIAIVSLIKWMERSGFKRDEWDFYDIDMLDPSDEELRSAFKAANPTAIGFSATVSTTYGHGSRKSTSA